MINGLDGVVGQLQLPSGIESYARIGSTVTQTYLTEMPEERARPRGVHVPYGDGTVLAQMRIGPQYRFAIVDASHVAEADRMSLAEKVLNIGPRQATLVVYTNK